MRNGHRAMDHPCRLTERRSDENDRGDEGTISEDNRTP